MATDKTNLAGEIAYQLTKRLVIDISTARAAVDAALSATPPAPAQPIDMLLYCPNCGVQHVDAPESKTYPRAQDTAGNWHCAEQRVWTNPPHRSHLCHSCGCIWRPADVPTNGVETIKTEGKADTWPVPHNEEVIAAIAQPSPEPSKPEQAEAPRNIIWDSTHPDYPVEWSNPGRPAREGEVHYIRYDLFSDAVHAAAPSPSAVQPLSEAQIEDGARSTQFWGLTLGEIFDIGDHAPEDDEEWELPAAGQKENEG